MTDYSHELIDDAQLSNMNPVDVFTCPSCGFVGCVVEYQENGNGYWDLDIPCDCEPRFCPNCVNASDSPQNPISVAAGCFSYEKANGVDNEPNPKEN